MNFIRNSVISLLLLSAPAVLSAQWSDSATVNTPVAPGPYDQVDARAAADGSGGAIVAWREFRPATGYDIFAGRLDTMGFGVWPAGGVAICTTFHDVFDIRLAPDGRGGAVIAWRETRSSSGPDIFAQRVDSNGVALWQPGGVVVTQADGTQDHLQVAGDGSGGSLVVWEDFRSGTNRNIYAQRIDSSGAAAWAAGGVSICGTGEDQVDPQLAADGGGGAFIVWEDFRSGTNFDIYAQRIDASGAAAWITDGVAVSIEPGDQLNPRIAARDGRAIIAWEDSRSGTSWDIYAQRVNASGILMWDPSAEAVCTAPQSQGSVDIADDGIGGAFIVWQDDRSGLSTDIYAQHINASAIILWAPGGTGVCTAPNHQFSPHVVSAGSGGAIVAWQDIRKGAYYDIFAQRVGAGGTAAWTGGGIGISTAEGNQTDPAIVSNGVGGAIIAWKDGRSSPPNGIFAQNVLAGGILGNLPWILATAGPKGAVSPAGITAVDRGGSLTLTFTPATGYHVDSVFINGLYAGAFPTYTFENIVGDSTLHVVFAINMYSITAIAGPHGSISQPGTITVIHGQTQAYAVTPDPGYAVGLLQVDGAEVPETTYYIFTNITSDHAIRAWFVNDSMSLASVAPRWNIVSAPLVAGDFSTSALYPSAVTGAYSFDGAYQPAIVMENGTGYWLKFDSAEVITLTGAPLHRDTFDVIEGWNMVGSISVRVPVGNIESVPGGIVTSQFFGYAAGYTPVASIRPAQGYWVKVAQAGQLVLAAAASASRANRISIVPTDEMPPDPPGASDEVAGGVGPVHGGQITRGFRLERNYPNPFNPSTVIRFELPASSDVLLEIYSVTGERVAVLIDDRLTSGLHSIEWDASRLSGGAYFCRLVAGSRIATQKLLLVK